MMKRICPQCGSDTWMAGEFPRVRDQAQWWEREAKRLVRELEVLRLDVAQAKWRDRTDVAWLQAKVVAQARELQRLNDRRNAERVRRNVKPRPDVTASSITVTEVNHRATQEELEERDATSTDG